MALFAVSYDLKKNKDYPTLWEEFTRLGGHKALESFYLLDLNTTAPLLRDHLRGFVDEDDMLMVVEFMGKPAFIRARQGTNDWISAHCL